MWPSVWAYLRMNSEKGIGDFRFWILDWVDGEVEMVRPWRLKSRLGKQNLPAQVSRTLVPVEGLRLPRCSFNCHRRRGDQNCGDRICGDRPGAAAWQLKSRLGERNLPVQVRRLNDGNAISQQRSPNSPTAVVIAIAARRTKPACAG